MIDMSIMERLFVEIFDRKNRIERQLHQQFESYGESLSLNFIANGGRLPPWLWEIGRGTGGCPDPGGLNKEQLISGICFPVPLVNASLADPRKSFTISEMRDDNVCIPISEVSKEPIVNKQNHNKAVEAEVIEDYSEHNELNLVSNSRSGQRDFESNLPRKANTINHNGEEETSSKKTGRTTRSNATSRKADCVKNSFVANKCAYMHNSRVTRSRSRRLAEASSNKLAAVESFYQVNDIANHPTECQNEIQQLHFVGQNCLSSDCRDNVDIPEMYEGGSAADNSISDKMQFVITSTLSDTISLIEHKAVKDIHGCQENENTFVGFSKEYQFQSHENSPNIFEALQTEPEKSTSIQTMGIHGSPNRHIQEGDMLHGADDINGIEADRSHREIEDDKVKFQPGLSKTSPAFFPTKNATSNLVEDILDNQVVNTVITRESSSGNSISHDREQQLFGQIKNASECDAILWPVEDNPTLGGTNLQFHKLKKGPSRIKSVTGLDEISKCASYVFSGNADHFHSLTEGSLCNAHVPSSDRQSLVGENLASLTSLIGEVESVPVEWQEDEHDVSEVDLKTSVVTLLELDSESVKHDSLSQFTDCSAFSSLSGSPNNLSMLKIHRNSASSTSLKGQIERKIFDNQLKGEKKRCEYSVHGCQSCSTSLEQERGLQKIQSGIFSTALSRSINFSAKALNSTQRNDVSSPNAHSFGTINDDSILLKFDRGAIVPDTAEKFITEKALKSGDGESYIVPSVSRYCMESSAVQNKDLNAYRSGGAFCVNKSKQPIDVIDCEYECSWPKRKKMKYKSNNIIASSSRSRARSFLYIDQQNECKYKATTSSEASVLKSPPKLSKISIPIVAPSMPEQNNDLHDLEDDSHCNSDIHDSLIGPNEDRQIKALQVCEENLYVCSRDDKARPTNLMPSEADNHHTSLVAESLFSDVDAFKNNASESLGHHDGFKELNDAQQCLYKYNTSISDNAGVKSNYDETMPVYEGFNIDLPYILEGHIGYEDADIPIIAKERALAIEQLRLSSIFPTPQAKPSASSPLGILENVDLGFSLEHNNTNIKHFAINSSELIESSCNIGSQFDGTTLERPHSSIAWFDSEPKNPPLTPFQKYSHGRLSEKRNSSSVTVNSVPEHICFRIDENSSNSEENADLFQVGYSSHQTFSKNIELSSSSKPLSDLTALYQNNKVFISNFNEFVVRNSLESINSGAESSLGFEFVGRESDIANKENPRQADDVQKLKKAVRTMSKMSESSRFSCKSSESTGNYQNIIKGCKPSNILSSISSFVPQVLQKRQGAPSLQGMKDKKIKALEIAEAAKRLEEQKKMEREKKKEEAKLAREKIKEENAKQMKLKQKQKEDDRRKKEEDVAARKRQREEEDRKVKERKKRCIEETRTLQRKREDKLHCEKDPKDPRQKVVDEKQKKRNQKTGKEKTETDKDGVNRSQMDVEVQHHTIQSLKLSDEHNTEKGVGSSSDLQDTNKETISATKICINLLSYDMSPYQNSDDEDVKDSWRKRKHIPLWARRESLDEIIHSNQQLDPKAIFSRKRSFNISQVLSTQVPRRRPLR